MAILLALITNIKQLILNYVPIKLPSVITTGLYSMPLVYFIILACVLLIAYFCWQSYRQEVSEAKLQERNAAKEENFSTHNLVWINKVINWAYMSSPDRIPEAVQRWMEDINITIAKTDSPIKILLYGIREGSIPPWIREVGQPQKKQGHIEVPMLLDAHEFGFTISVQEQDNGKLIASTYTAATAQFQCWYNVILSRIDGQGYLVKFEPLLDRYSSIKIGLKLQSNQKISTTVPEVVADIVKKGVLNTPFYLNISTWGPVIPTSSKRRKFSSPDRKSQKDTNGYSSSPRRRSTKRSQADEKGDGPSRRQNEPVLMVSPDDFGPLEGYSSLPKSATMPVGTPNALSERLKANHNHGLSGSLGSLVGIKRTPSGRGPAKPIRSREKRIIIKVVATSGLPVGKTLYCQASLDYPQQKSQTKLVEAKSNQSWPDDEMMFDLSSRSSEVKIAMMQKVDGAESAIASATLQLDKIDVDKKSDISLPLRTADNENAQVTLELDFTENSVDPASQKFISPRRSLDLSLIADRLPEIASDEKGDDKSKSTASTLSSLSSENMSSSRSTTVRTTTTTKKVSPRRKSASSGIPVSKSVPDIKKQGGDIESDVATCDGSVAETALKDLSTKAEKERLSPQSKANIKKGKVTITAISKSNVNGEHSHMPESDETGGEGGHAEHRGRLEKGGEMYYSTESMNAQNKSDKSAKPVNGEAEKFETSHSPSESNQQSESKKTRRRKDERPRSLVSGIKKEDMPKDKEWPKVRRSRSLVFGKMKKSKHYKTGSTTDLHKHANPAEENGYEDDSLLTVPENELQKHNKKKKSKSITKLFSKLGRKPSLRKSRRPSDIAEGEASSDRVSHSGSIVAETPELSTSDNPRPDPYTPSEGDSSTSEAMSPVSESGNLSLNEEKGVKRSKSLRKRLFGGRRKTTKN